MIAQQVRIENCFIIAGVLLIEVQESSWQAE
jgi:hypothetical protein